jgi:hypothetical protein
MIKRPTWILLILLALAIVAYFLVRNHNTADLSAASTPTTPVETFLVTTADGALQNLRVSDSQHIVEIRRNTSGTWIIDLPTAGLADESLVGAAETQINALRIVSTLDNQLNLADAGLTPPVSTIELAFASGIKHVLEVGSMTPSNSGYYVRYDAGNVYVISAAGVDALLNLLTAPPYLATATPSPTVEQTTTTPEAVTPIP